MAKYNEIMDRIEVSEEMQSRVLKGVDRHMAAKKRKKQLRIWLPVAGLAVAAAVLLVVMKPWSGRPEVKEPASTVGSTEISMAGTSTEQPATTAGPAVTTGGSEQSTGNIEDSGGIFQQTECGSVAELEKTVGFPVRELTDIPFKVTETGYRVIGKELAEAEYRGANESVCLRKSKGIEDNSGIYEEYSVNKKQTIAGCSVTMKGEGKQMILALWDDGTYSYSLYAEPGVSEESMVKMIEHMMQ